MCQACPLSQRSCFQWLQRFTCCSHASAEAKGAKHVGAPQRQYCTGIHVQGELQWCTIMRAPCAHASMSSSPRWYSLCVHVHHVPVNIRFVSIRPCWRLALMVVRHTRACAHVHVLVSELSTQRCASRACSRAQAPEQRIMCGSVSQ